ncbi:MAG TPA: hypothetical protein VGZ72_08950 [Stellaceae bacterium]|jgi:hypothetical protein|nr:hypothetical protein [Stellaceae bacterium]
MRRLSPERSATSAFVSSVWGAGLVVAGAAVGCLVLFDNKSFLDAAIQSDSLQLASAVWDYSSHDYAWAGLELARAPSIVPDLLVYGAIQLATGSWRLASLGYGGASLLAFAALAGLIVRDITGCARRAGAQAALLLALAVLLLELPITAASRHLVLLLPSHHGGSFILSLAALSVARGWLMQPKGPTLVVLLGLVIAGVLSDVLFVITGVGALLAVLAWMSLRRRIGLARLGLMLGCLAVGIAGARGLDRLLIREPMPAIDWESVPARAHAFLSSLVELAAGAPLTVLLADAVPLMALVVYPLVAGRKSKGDGAIEAVEFWWVASAGSVLASVLAMPLHYEDLASYRYATALLWWPPIWAAAGLTRWAGWARGSVVATALGGVAVVLAFAYFWPGPHVPALLSLPRPLEACLVEGERFAGLKAGLADYWRARTVEASSDWRLQVDQIDRVGAALYWGNDRFWYGHDIHDGARAPEYNYIVMAGLDEGAIALHYGAPSRTLDCGGVAVWIYDDAASVRRALVSLSPVLSAANKSDR